MQPADIQQEEVVHPTIRPVRSRLGRSPACRNWYRWRQLAKDQPAPLRVSLSPPWPVARLACRMKGTSPLLAVVLTPFALLACMDDDRTDTLAIGREPSP